MKNKKIGVVLRLIISLLVIGIVVGIGYLILKHYGLTNVSVEQLRDRVAKTGAWGGIVFIIISFLQVTFIPIPATITILAGNLLFGPWLSFLYSLIGCLLGSFLAFKLGRVFGRPFVNWVVGDKETVDKYLQKVRGKEFVVFFFMFLLPMFPDDALCAVAGITILSWKEFSFIQLICRPIGIVATLFFMSGEIIPYHGWGLVVLGAIAVLSIVCFIICYKKADKINELLNKFFDKIHNIFHKNKNDN